MLYVTTRSNTDAYTANRALCEHRAPDGGLYVPFRMPYFSREELTALGEKTFDQRIAQVLNLLFGCRISGRDVELAIGSRPVRLVSLNHKIMIGELWHSSQGDFSRISRKLIRMIRPEASAEGDWPALGVRIAFLIALFGELLKDGDIPIDIAMSSEDLSAAMAALYAREWGFSVGNVIICCNDNASLWDLLRRGELRTNQVAVTTNTPLCDQVLPRDLERLIYSCGGVPEVERYLQACRTGSLYCPSDRIHKTLCRSIQVSVIGEARTESAVPNVYRTHAYLCGPYTALCYSGLLDYRSRGGERRRALIWSERSPLRDGVFTAAAMGISVPELEDYIK